MPTNRVRRRRVFEPTITPTQWALLCDEPIPQDGPMDGAIDRWCFDADEPAKANAWGRRSAAELWAEHGVTVIEQWVAEYPGTRPSTWWRCEAPRATPGDYQAAISFRPDVAQPRRRLGGIGTPKFEVLAHVPLFWCGVPLDWVSRWEVEYYGDRRAEIGLPPSNRPFLGLAIDRDDPPMFESEAAYLDRHGLLRPGERRRLKPVDFEPKSILAILELEPA